jgi:hypothetical protein
MSKFEPEPTRHRRLIVQDGDVAKWKMPSRATVEEDEVWSACTALKKMLL